MRNVRHVMGISGGKDSGALAIYLFEKYPHLDIEYYFTDTGKELQETYDLIRNIETHTGKKVIHIEAAEKSHEDPFDHFLKLYGGYLPSSNARWCTKKLKLEPFEDWVGDDLVISYVGIRGDEDREGYISRKGNIQSIFPFRRNIWSEDVIGKVLKNSNIENLLTWYDDYIPAQKLLRIQEVVEEIISPRYTIKDKLNDLLDIDIQAFNRVVFEFLKTTQYPLAYENDFALLDNEDNLVREDIFKILNNSGVGVPKYYEKIEFELNGQKGEYARSRSGCFFCFYQQKIEWIWLYEQHRELFNKALQYEKDGYTWMQDESLEDIVKPERMAQIKEQQIKKLQKNNQNKKSAYLLDLLDDSEGEGCASCFI
ncbi:phosphoadenosine phosphosulfate reductase family protein [Chryseobacterium sp. SN22]|uniref:phosphoadenosine phosphosulfate reductase family protein n=1 Tax=Chryseobacterium sp. SN22 TaxID=2606431 RepID=UPI0011F0707F|nr:phosphoadenosine phosphosulfate reductase family protein [Chryseobacterium sp. SN22]KAA0126805.1 phosphoadenosine phosphosulfate reductase family protein [Chryseobacterium sp. SN22]